MILAKLSVPLCYSLISRITFIGVDDVVRCHYCDGGLRNWESADDPWEEHARWFPFCKYIIKMKGKEYIDSIRRKYEVWIDESYIYIYATAKKFVVLLHYGSVVMRIKVGVYLLGHILTAFQQAKGHQNTKKKQFMCL
jgi:hypothetical protein